MIRPRTYYYEIEERPRDNATEGEVEEIFNNNLKVYGSRKIKVEFVHGRNFESLDRLRLELSD